MKTPRNQGFTLIELLVVITIIAILASIAVPVYNGITIRAEQTKALSNAKQIALGCKIFAIDNDGIFPDIANGVPLSGAGVYAGGETGATENFAALVDGKYLPSETIFWISKERNGTTRLVKPDDDISAGQGADFKKANVAWGYTSGADDSANPSLPLVYTRSATAGVWPYDDTTAEGGVWRDKIISVSIDYAGALQKIDAASGTILIPKGTTTTNLFTEPSMWGSSMAYTINNN